MTQRTVTFKESKDGLSSGLSFQHFSISSIKLSGQSFCSTVGRNGGDSRAHTLFIISSKKINLRFQDFKFDFLYVALLLFTLWF